jgi:hypothetical protein
MSERAYRTLRNGCLFLDQRAGQRPAPGQGWAIHAHNRMVGNSLRELDRFLSVLIDDVAGGLDREGHDRRAFARLRNTAYKLRLLDGMMAPAGHWADRLLAGDGRLRAIGRLKSCLHDCAGRVHDVALHKDLLIAGDQAGLGLRRPAATGTVDDCAGGSKRLEIDAQTISAICAFYIEIGDRLWPAGRRPGRDLDFTGHSAHIVSANVA